ncbi:MAG: c-type cytochrome [Rubrivivax sp.]|jgi:cytochrome c|nr:c-type cytochrome [Rubrivivax sp.]
MKIRLIVLAAAALVAGPVLASQDLANKKGCMGCHAVDKKLVGPSYKDVAAKYAKDKDAVTKLATKIKAGGSGVWGPIPMPANNVTPEEAKALATWVMATK